MACPHFPKFRCRMRNKTLNSYFLGNVDCCCFLAPIMRLERQGQHDGTKWHLLPCMSTDFKAAATGATGRDRIELKLAIGASRWEATQETLQRSVKVALTPILNQMNVVGIVSIPGMMTGQILSGSDPSQVHLAETQRGHDCMASCMSNAACPSGSVCVPHEPPSHEQ